MERIINKPIAETFSWLKVGGKSVELQGEIKTTRIQVEAGGEKTMILDGKENVAQYEIELAKDSSLRLIQIGKILDDDINESSTKEGNIAGKACNKTDQTITFTDIRVNCQENAAFHWYRLVLNAAETYDNVEVVLEGKNASFTAAVGYDLKKEEQYDLNCAAIHLGKKTISDIKASGVLSGQAGKLMRGTIDLRKGCKGAEGNEAEDVFLMDDAVRNQSVPVILCGEEDVVGNHGASIGRPDEAILYYMGTRGIDEETAYKLLSRSKIDGVIDQIPDQELVERLRAKIEEN